MRAEPIILLPLALLTFFEPVHISSNQSNFPISDDHIKRDVQDIIQGHLQGLFNIFKVTIKKRTQFRNPFERYIYPYAYVSFMAIRNGKEPTDLKVKLGDRFETTPFYYLHSRNKGYKFEGELKLRYVHVKDGWLLERSIQLLSYPLQPYLQVDGLELNGYVHPKK